MGVPRSSEEFRSSVDGYHYIHAGAARYNEYSMYSTDMCGSSSLLCVCIDGRKKKKLTVPLGGE
jgi:hypothetical protein